MNEQKLDNINKFFEIFRKLSLEDQKKALLIIQGMSISGSSKEKEENSLIKTE